MTRHQIARSAAWAVFAVAFAFAALAILDWRLGQIAQITRV